jgi:linoleoyl-CoA desaturase
MQPVIKPSFRKSKQDYLFNELRKQVYTRINGVNYQRKIYFKALLFPFLYFAVYVLMLMLGHNRLVLWSAYICMGILLLLNFLNNLHEAAHHCLFKNRKANDYYLFLFDLMGANSYIWKVRHTRLHHNYSNIKGWDTDIEQSPLARIFPDGKYFYIHRYQHIYLPLLYPLYLFNWLLIRDFKDFFSAERTVRKLLPVIPVSEYVKLFVFKTLFLFNLIILPKYILGVSWGTILTAFGLMIFTASVFSLIVLLSPHANIKNEFTLIDASGNMRYDWLRHHLHCTNDITHDNRFTRFFMGCFNYHVAHHLFPTIHHLYYPEVTEVIKDFTRQHQLPYKSYSLAESLSYHYRLLKKNNRPENLLEETM